MRRGSLLTARVVKLARDAGALTVLTFVLSTRSIVHVFAREFAMAASLVEQGAAVAESTASRVVPYGAPALAVWRGREAEACRLIDAATEGFCAAGEGMALALAEWARAVLYTVLPDMTRRKPRPSGSATIRTSCGSPPGRCPSCSKRPCGP